jgi:Ser/Thr protein kinase RdoA (MazF antagonist)
VRARTRLVEGYESMRAFDRRTLALVEPLRALRVLRYAAWIGARYRDPAFQRAFPEYEEHRWWQREIESLATVLDAVTAAPAG